MTAKVYDFLYERAKRNGILVVENEDVDSFCDAWLRAMNENVDADTRAELDFLDKQK